MWVGSGQVSWVYSVFMWLVWKRNSPIRRKQTRCSRLRMSLVGEIPNLFQDWQSNCSLRAHFPHNPSINAAQRYKQDKCILWKVLFLNQWRLQVYDQWAHFLSLLGLLWDGDFLFNDPLRFQKWTPVAGSTWECRFRSGSPSSPLFGEEAEFEMINHKSA